MDTVKNPRRNSSYKNTVACRICLRYNYLRGARTHNDQNQGRSSSLTWNIASGINRCTAHEETSPGVLHRFQWNFARRFNTIYDYGKILSWIGFKKWSRGGLYGSEIEIFVLVLSNDSEEIFALLEISLKLLIWLCGKIFLCTVVLCDTTKVRFYPYIGIILNERSLVALWFAFITYRERSVTYTSLIIQRDNIKEQVFWWIVYQAVLNKC